MASPGEISLYKKDESKLLCIDGDLRSRLIDAAARVRGAVHEATHVLETLLAKTQAVKTPPRVVVLYPDEYPKWWAEKLLKAFLADGPMPETAIWREMAEAGIAERTYYKARRQLGIKSTRVGGAAHHGHWVLSLPKTIGR